MWDRARQPNPLLFDSAKASSKPAEAHCEPARSAVRAERANEERASTNHENDEHHADMTQQEETLGKVYDGRLMRRLLAYLAPYRLVVAVSLVLVLLISALKLVGPILTKIAIDDYIAAGDLPGSRNVAVALRARARAAVRRRPTSRSTS